MDLRISVTGCDEVARLLRALPDELREKYGRQGLKAAAEITVAAVQARIPGGGTGLARASIGFSPIKFYRHSGTLFTAIEPRKGYRRIIAISSTGRRRIFGKKVLEVKAEAGRVQDPRRYLHIIERGRRAVRPIRARALHSALDPENRFFMHAQATSPHPVFAPAAAAVDAACRIAVETELQKGVDEFNRREN